MPTSAQAGMSPESSVHIHEIYIRADAAAIWEAITQPEWTAQYGYRALSEYDLKPGGRFQCKANLQMRQMGLPEIICDGEVVEVQPPYKLVQTYRFLFNAEHVAEGFTRITWEIVPTGKGFCRLTVTHDTQHATMMTRAITSKYSIDGGGGWNWILSDLKSLLESGKTL